MNFIKKHIFQLYNVFETKNVLNWMMLEKKLDQIFFHKFQKFHRSLKEISIKNR